MWIKQETKEERNERLKRIYARTMNQSELKNWLNERSKQDILSQAKVVKRPCKCKRNEIKQPPA